VDGHSDEDDSRENQRYLDIGCSTHMTCKKYWFINLDESKKNIVKFADDSKLASQGIVKVMIKRKYEKHSLITNALYGSSVKSNLPNLGQLLEKGYLMIMEDKMLKIMDIKSEVQVMEHRCSCSQ